MTWPIIIVQDRYGRGWVAVAEADRREVVSMLEIGEDGPWGGDWAASEFEKNPGPLAAYGKTPDAALRNLEAKIALPAPVGGVSK